jgi:hypothetical protein
MQAVTMSFPCAIPDAVREEHEELHRRLSEATLAGGRVGAAAKKAARLLHAHLIREEELAMRPLGLLRALAEGAVTADMAGVLGLTNALRDELPRMLAEHRQIVLALNTLREAAHEEDRPSFGELADELILHARMEEEILYPAALLVGEFLKLKLKAR